MPNPKSVKLPDTKQYYCLCDLASLPLGTSLIVTNNTGGQIRIYQSEIAPTGNKEGFPVWPNETVLVHGNNVMPVWCKGGTDGVIIVQALTSTVLPLTGVEFAQDIVTSGIEGFRRLQVDQGQTGFFEAREFRITEKIRMSTVGQKITFKFSSLVDFIVFKQSFSITSGAYEFHAWRENNVTENTAFTTPVNIINKNESSEYRDYGGRYQTQVSINRGGTITIADVGQYVDYEDMITSNATAQRVSIGQSNNDQRYLPAGNYYLEFTCLDAPVRGIYNVAWEERPEGVK